APRELPYVPDMFEVRTKHNDRKGTRAIVLAEVQKSSPSTPFLYVKDSSANALGLTDMLVRVREGNAFRGGVQAPEHDQRQRNREERIGFHRGTGGLENQGQTVSNDFRLYQKKRSAEKK